MNRTDAQSLLFFSLIVLAGVFIGWAGSQGGLTVGGVPLFGLAVGLAYLFQWLVFLPSFRFQTEKFFDLTGQPDLYHHHAAPAAARARAGCPRLAPGAHSSWSGRCGWAVFSSCGFCAPDGMTVSEALKPSFWRFLNVWTLQGLWVAFTAGAGWAAITSPQRLPLDAFALTGGLLWAAGFVFEVVADEQKRRFQADPANRGQFIRSGLWRLSRHPNYFGEILLWAGVALMAFPVLSGWRALTLLSPVFVAFLLTRVSGIPLLEQKADARWGGQPDYEEYKRRTPLLIPACGRDFHNFFCNCLLIRFG